MTTLRGSTHHIPASRLHVSARTVAIALAAALAIALAALAISLASPSAGGTDAVRVQPAPGPIPPSTAERKQLRGLDGPGARP